jgi:hypothetical protein
MGAIKRSESLNTSSKGVSFVHCVMVNAFATPSDAPASQRDGWRMPPGAANAATTMPAKAAFTKRRIPHGFVSTGG